MYCREDNWWKTATVYHIYPRSYMDSSGNGIGDIKGIISKLDYIESIGFSTIWISPFFLSPGEDFGYDISDYLKIDPLLGNMVDVEQLILECHKRDIKIIFDMVLNHTSNKHNWFLDSCSSIESPKRDWYIWLKGKDSEGKIPPNNWKTMLGRRAWTYNKTRDEWYYSSFFNFQPDLNYSNKEVKKEIFNIVRYWLKKGVDGFRLDIFNCIGKDSKYRDNPFTLRYIPTPNNNDRCFWQSKIYNLNHPDSVVFSKELRAVVEEFDNRVLIGEVSGDHNKIKSYLGDNHDGLNMVFLFELLHYRYSKKFFYNFLANLEQDFTEPYIPTIVFSNHDNSRSIERINNSLYRAKIIALIQLTVRGVPFIYYGEEIGMINNNIKLKNAKDPLAKLYRYLPKFIAKILDIFINRDDCRTPMQWDDSVTRGFTSMNVKPWLPIVKKSEKRDVKSQLDIRGSLLETYKKLLDIRTTYRALELGILELIDDKKLLIFKRVYNDEKLLIIINLTSKAINYLVPNSAKLIYPVNAVKVDSSNKILFNGDSGAIFKI